jgi:hypothetical protein
MAAGLASRTVHGQTAETGMNGKCRACPSWAHLLCVGVLALEFLGLHGLWDVVALAYKMPWPITRWHRSLPSWTSMPLLVT